MTLFLAPLRLFVSPVSIAIINLLIIVLMVLSIVDVAKSIGLRANPDELVNIMTTVSSIMIGWGVALESREVIRKVSGYHGLKDEDRQSHIDAQCNSYGVAQLVLGLFADIPVAMISLPDRIINASGIEYELLWASVVLIGIAAVIQARHVTILLLGR